MSAKYNKILQEFQSKDKLIPALQAVQAKIGYLPSVALRAVAKHFKLPASHVFGVVSFYSQFYLSPQGKNKIRICCGTACHVRGSGKIVEAVSKELGIASGETTADAKYTLEEMACFGSCALAPVAVINDKVYGTINAEKLLSIIRKLK